MINDKKKGEQCQWGDGGCGGVGLIGRVSGEHTTHNSGDKLRKRSNRLTVITKGIPSPF